MTRNTRTQTITETATPTGQPGLRITCTNPNHSHNGKSAVMRMPETLPSPTRACKLIEAAYHPFAAAASQQRLGPWKA